MVALFLFRGFHLIIRSRGKNIFYIDIIDEMEINIINNPQSKLISNEHSISLKFKVVYILITGITYYFSHKVKDGRTWCVV